MGRLNFQFTSRANISNTGNDLDAYEKETLKVLPAWMVYDFRLMCALCQEHAL